MAKRKRGRHTSAGKELEHSIRWLEGLPYVEKVVLHLAEACRTQYPPGHLRATREAPGGVKLVGHSGNGIVNLFVRVDDAHKSALLAAIEERYGARG